MILAYGITQQGTSHIKEGTVCQDAHSIVKSSSGMAFAAVADGLGSETYSDVASKIAADVSTKYCAENIEPTTSDEDILKTICQSFNLSQQKIEEIADTRGHEVDQYDTTLSLAVLIGDSLYYGQSGDSGIVALTTDGLFVRVTEQQRDEENRVFPLYFGENKWVWGKFESKVASVLLATDGMLETLFPVYLQNEPSDIYVALTRFFMDPDSLRIKEIGEDAAKDKIEKYMNSIPGTIVNDDKTIVVLLNTEIEIHPQPPEYYIEPNWDELKQKYREAWEKKAYPHLFQAKAETSASKTHTDLEAFVDNNQLNKKDSSVSGNNINTPNTSEEFNDSTSLKESKTE